MTSPLRIAACTLTLLFGCSDSRERGVEDTGPGSTIEDAGLPADRTSEDSGRDTPPDADAGDARMGDACVHGDFAEGEPCCNPGEERCRPGYVGRGLSC